MCYVISFQVKKALKRMCYVMSYCFKRIVFKALYRS